MKYLLIANPSSGSGAAGRELAYVRRYFERHGHELVARLTERPGHAEELAAAAASGGWDAIIAGGGDGTINEVLNGMRGCGTPLGIIPWGTGNVFATEMRFPRGIAGVCRMILRGRSELVDAGLYGGRRFLLMVGAGLDGYTLRRLEGQGLKRRLGVIAYAVSAVLAFARYRYPEILVELPDGRVDRGSFVIVSNTSRYGDFFSFTPTASPFDGLLDVFVFRETGRWQTVILALRYLARFMADPNLTTPPLGLQRWALYRTARVRLSSAKRVFTQVDGEAGLSLPIDISVEPRAVRLILPKRSIRRYRRGPGAADRAPPPRDR